MIALPLAERRAMAYAALRDHADWTDRRIAGHTGLSQSLIQRMRSVLVQGGEIPIVTEAIGRDGKTYRGPKGIIPRRTLRVRIAELRKLMAGIDDATWRAAEPRDRKLFWHLADHLADSAGQSIDRETGRLYG